MNQSAKQLSPYLLANYIYILVKSYNSFYQEFPILSEVNQDCKNFRIKLSKLVSEIIGSGMRVLGIEMPERM